MKTPEDQLKNVESILKDRLNILKSCMIEPEYDEHGYMNAYDAQMRNEIIFLESLLDIIEKG